MNQLFDGCGNMLMVLVIGIVAIALLIATANAVAPLSELSGQQETEHRQRQVER